MIRLRPSAFAGQVRLRRKGVPASRRQVRRANSACIAVLALATMLFRPTSAEAQYATKPGDSVGTAGGACAGSTVNFGWPDANGHILQLDYPSVSAAFLIAAMDR
jgi:hypothetical protein